MPWSGVQEGMSTGHFHGCVSHHHSCPWKGEELWVSCPSVWKKLHIPFHTHLLWLCHVTALSHKCGKYSLVSKKKSKKLISLHGIFAHLCVSEGFCPYHHTGKTMRLWTEPAREKKNVNTKVKNISILINVKLLYKMLKLCWNTCVCTQIFPSEHSSLFFF